MATTPRKGKNYCARHDTSYGALEQCGACEDDPGPAPDDAIAEEPVEFPEGIDDPDCQLRGWGEDLEDLIALRRTIYSKSHGNTDGVLDTHLINAYGKIQDAISKIRRSLIDEGHKRRDAVLVDRREKRLTKATRGAAH